jgi:ketosteroid isomerase-like protein
MASTAAEIVRRFYSAYSSRDKKTAEELLSDNFTFTSPYDDHIDKKAYFERCWPVSPAFRKSEVEQILGDEQGAFIRYQIHLHEGAPFRNTEYLRVENDQITSVEVFFGALDSTALRPSLEPKKRGAAEERLQVFEGKWTMEGRAFDSPFGKAASIAAMETFEWLTGGLYLIHRLDGRLGNDPIACVELVEANRAATFYNNGTFNIWDVREENGAWIFRGRWNNAEVSCTTRFGDGGQSRTGKWEYSTDGSEWKTFWETRATRASRPDRAK